MFKKPRLIILVVLVLMVLVLLALPVRTASQLKLAISTLFLPLFGLSGAFHSATEQAGNLVLPRRALVEQLHQLQEENRALRFQLMQAEEAIHENSRFRQFYGFQQRSAWKPRLAHVIGRDPANWWRAVIIDLGSTDGIQTNQAVITPEGLVGRIDRAGIKQSVVTLVGDPHCLVSALVQETRDHGIVTPASSASLDYQFVDLTHLARSSAAQPGHKVLTSGLGGIFPKGIPIGDILEVRSVDYGLYAEARVRLLAKLNALEEVFVLMP